MDADMMDVADDGPTQQELEVDPKPSPFHTEFYRGAALIVGQGQTFMDIFDKDQYAANRKENIYYPFKSQSEWELASFLLKSDLSMAATDEFLKLQSVSLAICLKIFYFKNSISYRSLALDYRFGLQRISAIELRFFQRMD